MQKENREPKAKLRLVKAAAIYGANASGKSNLIQAMVWFRTFVLQSSKEGQVGEGIDIEPFLLSQVNLLLNPFFEIPSSRRLAITRLLLSSLSRFIR